MQRRARAEATARVRLRTPTAGAARRRVADRAGRTRTRHPGLRLRDRGLLGLARVQPLRALAIEPTHCDPGGMTALPDGLRDAPLDLHPIVDAPEAHPAQHRAPPAQREETLAESVRATAIATAIER